MTNATNLQNVIDHDLCIGCGACLACDSNLKLELNLEKLMYEPSGPGNQEAAEICPAIGVDFDWLHEQRFPDQEISALGAVDSVALAQSTDRDRNLRASSGGMIKELARYFMALDEVDGLISLDHEQGLRYGAKLVTNPDEIDQLPGSIYHNIPFDNALRILQENEGRYVLIAIPCQLEGIYSYIYRHAPHLAQRVYATIGLICGWTFTHHAIRAISQFKGVDPDTLNNITFRGGGPIGNLCLSTPDGDVQVNRRVDFGYQVAFDRSFNIPRCHLCIDHTNFLADIVVGDAWLPCTVRTQTGVSLVIARNKRMTEVMQTMTQQGKIRQVEASHDDVVESQTRRVAYGDFSYAYADYLREEGIFRPEMTGPNRSAAKLVPREKVEQFHKENQLKIKLQREGKYSRLKIRKITVEFGRFSYRYVRWLFVRIFKIKSLLGQRKEISKSEMDDFI